MVYELRTYSAMPGRLPDLNRRFADITMGFFKKHDIQVVGFWTNELGGSSDQLIYMLAYDSLEMSWSEEPPSSLVGSSDQLIYMLAYDSL